MKKEHHKGAERKHQNGGFSTSIGFVLACVGSAVGLGNIWMFPYRLGQYGGAAFLLPYLFFILLFGLVGLSAEFAIGRRAGTGTLGAYEYCFQRIGKGKLGRIIGWIPLMGSLGIAIGYSIIIGWVLRSLFGSLTGVIFQKEADVYFAEATKTLGSVPWHVIIIVITMIILITGATKGIEKANRILMPIFFLLFAILAVRVLFLEGSKTGYEFLFVPKWETLGNINTWVMAMGQAFFSLSITGSGMIVYGSYLNKKEDITKASLRTSFFDTIAALLSALAIMPAVFAFGIAPDRGPSLMFITIPNVFKQMPFGRIFAVIFFTSVCFAGITSLINMFEAVIESWQIRFHLARTKAVILCGTITLLIGLFLEEETKVGMWLDFITIVVVPIGAVLGAISIYYILGYKEIKEELEEGRKKPLPAWFGIVAKYFYVPLAALIVILGFIYKGIG